MVETPPRRNGERSRGVQYDGLARAPDDPGEEQDDFGTASQLVGRVPSLTPPPVGVSDATLDDIHSDDSDGHETSVGGPDPPDVGGNNAARWQKGPPSRKADLKGAKKPLL